MRPRFKSGASTSRAPQYRWVLACVFAALQLYKLASVGSGAFAKFCAIDAFFVIAVSKMRVPRLNFRPSVLLAIVSALVLLNAFLFDRALIKQPIMLLLSLSGRKMAVTGSRVRPESQHSLARQHLKGKYTVNFLPESLATLQIDEPVCLDGSAPSYFHIVLNNTTPQTISLAGKRFDDTEFSVEFSHRQIRKFHTKTRDQLTHMFLPVTEPGYYRLQSVVDKSAANVKVKGPAVLVPTCPTVKITPPEYNTVCQDGNFAPLVSLHGVAPFHVVLANKTAFSVGSAAGSAGAEYKLETLLSHVRLDTRQAGHSRLEIVAVKDALDNWSNTSASAEVRVFSPPTIRRTSAADQVPLLDGAMASFSIDSDDLPVQLVYSSPDQQKHTVSINSNRFDLPLKQQGTWTLEELRGSVCSSGGTIQGPKSLSVFEPPETGLEVTFEQLKDKCSGPTGINTDLKFKGTPPFKVWYRTLVGSRVVHQDVLDSNSLEDIITFKPGSVGTFKYQVTAVKDRYRKVDLQGPEYEQTQTIRELAGAQFYGGAKTSYCPEEAAFITAKVQGKGPLSIVYEVDNKQYTEDNVDGDLTINLGKLGGGAHRVTLKSITDVEGCTTPLNIQSPVLNVRSNLANAKFSGQKSIKVYDAHLKLPLGISNAAGGTKRLKYSVNSTEITTTLSGFELPISQPGTYKLLEFDDGCPGTVGSEEVVVSLYERPSVELIDQTTAICYGGISDETIKLKGEPPFKVWSEIVDPNGKSVYDVRETANNKVKYTNKPREIPGTWTTYYWLADKVYPKGDKSQGALVVKQTVWSEPVVMHSKPGSHYSLCQSIKKEGVPINLNGVGPFVVTVELKNSNGRITTHHIDIPADHPISRPYNLYEPFENLAGSFQVRLVSVRDSRGCTGHPVASKSIVHVKTVGAPQLEVEKHDYCVGDYVTLQGKGTGPLKLDYTLNKRKHSVKGDRSFKLLAPTPGQLHLLNLEDDTPCPAQLDTMITVHDLPSSGITRQPSFNIHRDEEVELQFAFTGTAPFTFVYTRTVDGREVERHTVRDVQEHKYSINVNENGVYEVVSLKDAYCSVSL